MLKMWCEVTTCGGIIDLYQSKENKKHFIFWAMAVASMFACSIFFTYRTLVGYIDTPTVTNIDTIMKSEMELPEVLVSYKGGFNVAALRNANLSDEFIHSLNLNPQSEITDMVKQARLIDELTRFMQTHSIGIVDFAERFGYDCRDLIMSIIHIDNSYYGCENATFFLREIGNNVVLKNLPPQWFPGAFAGITLTLKAPTNSYFQIYPKKAIERNMKNEFQLSLEKSIGHSLSTGRYYTIPLNAQVEIALIPKYYKRINGVRKCSDSTETFSSNFCFYQCWLSDIAECLGCTPLMAYGDGSKYNQSQMCNPFVTAIHCYTKDHVKKCNDNCLPLCEEWIYEATIGYSYFDPALLNEPSSIVVIGFNNMQYTKIEEMNAFTIDMAISNVGGQSGLWLGISMVTIIQAIYYAILGVSKKMEGKQIGMQK